MKKTIYSCLIALFVAGSSTLVSCLGDLDLKPIDKNLIQDSDFKSHHEYYTQFLAKVYAGLAVSGQEGPAGKPDIEGFDEGMAQYPVILESSGIADRRSFIRMERCRRTRIKHFKMVCCKRVYICHV